MAIMTPPAASEEDDDFAIGEGPATVVSISMPKGTLKALRKLVGKRGLSAALTAAIEKQLRDAAFREDAAEYVAEHGEFTEEERAKSHALFSRAAEREAAWRATHQ